MCIPNEHILPPVATAAATPEPQATATLAPSYLHTLASELLDDRINTAANDAAAELDSPNSFDFEALQERLTDAPETLRMAALDLTWSLLQDIHRLQVQLRDRTCLLTQLGEMRPQPLEMRQRIDVALDKSAHALAQSRRLTGVYPDLLTQALPLFNQGHCARAPQHALSVPDVDDIEDDHHARLVEINR